MTCKNYLAFDICKISKKKEDEKSSSCRKRKIEENFENAGHSRVNHL